MLIARKILTDPTESLTASVEFTKQNYNYTQNVLLPEPAWTRILPVSFVI